MTAGLIFKMTPVASVVQKLLAAKSAGMANTLPAYKKASIYLDKWVQENFKSEGGKVGGWVPFSPYTLVMIQKYDPSRTPAKLLQKTGRLRSSFVPFATSKNAGIGSELPYAKTHEEGFGNIPMRRMLPKRQEVIGDINRIINDHVKGALKKK